MIPFLGLTMFKVLAQEAQNTVAGKISKRSGSIWFAQCLQYIKFIH
jgi:hypothetical protein